MKRKRSTGIRSYFVGMLLLGLIPVAIFAAVLLIQLWSLQRDQLRVRHEAVVALVADAVATDLNESISRLEILGSSPLLKEQSLEQLQRFARDSFLARTPAWRSVVMIEAATGEQVFNLAADQGARLPRSGDRPHQSEVKASKRPVVSDLFVGRTTGRQVVEVAVPVLVDGDVRYILSAPLSLQRLTRLLEERVTESGVAVVVDSRKLIIARTRGGADYVGKKTVPNLHASMQEAPSGWARFTAFEGDAVYSAWAPVPGYGWSVAYGIPAAPIEGALTQSLALLGGIGLLVTVGSGWFALTASRRMGATIHAASVAAKDAASGQSVAPTTSGIVELDALNLSLREAAQRVASETASRAKAERERNLLLDNERAARAQAEAESRAKDEFLATLGHELRNPLAAIANAASVLSRAAPLDASAQRAVEVIQRQSTHQSRLLEDLLDVARVTTGKLALRLEPLDLAESVLAALDSLRNKASAQHDIVTSLTSVWVNGDSDRIEQIVVNLVGNALKFNPAGGRITVTVDQQDRHAVLQVQDTGIGIEAPLLSRVFDLFSQGDHALDPGVGGLGIGLTLVRRLAELHGGEVAVASAGRGKGAAFTVRIPAIVPPVVSIADSRGSRKPHAGHILLVEDNPDVREMTEALLALDGHTVTTVATGAAAIDAIANCSPDVAVIDIGLPDIGGDEVAHRLRAQKGNEIFLISLSGFGIAHHSEVFDAQLIKPVDPAQLAAVLDEALGSASRRSVANSTKPAPP